MALVSCGAGEASGSSDSALATYTTEYRQQVIAVSTCSLLVSCIVLSVELVQVTCGTVQVVAGSSDSALSEQ